MSRVLVVVNPASGHYRQGIVDRLRRLGAASICRLVGAPVLEGEVSYDVCHVDDAVERYASGGYALLVVVGGDGTLHSVLNRLPEPVPMFYVPSGTLNEKYKTHGARAGTSLVLGRMGPDLYTYVAAAGSFTPIGYRARVATKKRFGKLAYLALVVREYRVHRIEAEVVADGEAYRGPFTLVMFIHSPRCFGFNFNKMHRNEAQNGQLLLIKAPRHTGFLGKIRMFFPFFRAFFVGFRRPYRSKTMIFRTFEHASLTLQASTDFDVDGERRTLTGTLDMDFAPYAAPFGVWERRRFDGIRHPSTKPHSR